MSLAGVGGRELQACKLQQQQFRPSGARDRDLEKCTGGRVTCARLKSEQTSSDPELEALAVGVGGFLARAAPART